MSFSAYADCSCRTLKLIEKTTYEKPAKTGLIVDKDSHSEMLKVYGIKLSTKEQVSIFATEEHGYGGGAYSIASMKQESSNFTVKLEFEADLFSVGTAATNHRLLFFITNKPCYVGAVNVSNF